MPLIGIWRKSIFVRLMLTFLLIMVPLYGIGIGAYQWGVSALKRELSGAQTSQMVYYLEKIEKEIQGLKLVQSETLYTEDIQTLANNNEYLTDYERGYYLNKLQQRLNAIKNGSVYVENVTAYIPSIKRLVPAVGSISEMQEADWERMKLTDNATRSQLAYADKRLFLNAFFPPSYTGENPPLSYALLIKLSIPGLKDSLAQFERNESGSGVFLMSAAKDLLIFNDPPGSAQETIRELVRSELADDQTSGDGSQSVMLGKERYLYLYQTSPYLGLTLVSYTPERALFAGLQKYEVWFWLLSAAVLLLIVLFSLAIIRFIRVPLYTLIRSFKRIEKGEMDFEIVHRSKDEFGFIYERFNSMLERLSSLIDQNYRQRIMVQRAELKQLQAQINPHFLYNSFFILYTMTKRGDYDELMAFELQLGEYFEFITRNTSDEVTLEREVSHARTYSLIQQKRFGERIAVSFGELPESCGGLMVPRLILQPIIENAYEHGLERMEENGRLEVCFELDDDALRVTLRNNGGRMEEARLNQLQALLETDTYDDEVTGFVNIHRRIRLYFGDRGRYGLTVSNTEDGIEAVLRLPKP
ncbi:sensor histidine kinase [Cohnella cellulosilytica]|uniref:Sensor histidine kinase n=1 Tax=Cohnella cellulosilytica TaxID=986710 RepID=A0ABW2F906_9BACL